MNAISKEVFFSLLQKEVLRYPHMEPKDLFKFLYQGAFGCEHMVTDKTKAVARICEEEKVLPPKETDEITLLPGDYIRVPLGLIQKGLSPQTLGTLFFLSAKKEEKGRELLQTHLNWAKEGIRDGLLPFSLELFSLSFKEWEKEDFSPLHHSDEFRTRYAPSYRVIAKEFLPFFPLFCALDKALPKGDLLLALEGGSASGKTTLSKVLETVYGGTVFHMDDFFLQAHQRNPERFKTVGGNVDWERFLSQVLIPLKEGKEISYQAFDCTTMTLKEAKKVRPHGLIVVEGAYSMHPSLAPYYDLSAFLKITPEFQKKRIEKRNTPALAQRFFSEWIPMEDRYFSQTKVEERCTMVLPIEE